MELLRATSARQLSKLRFNAPVARRSWVCSGCVARQKVASRKWASSKPYYVTTPIFYVNAAPHVGHMYTMVLTDVLKRWQTLNGRKALLCTGTDEHGMKVQSAAAREGVPPKEFCDVYAATFQDLAHAANIDNDFFIRTTDEDHKQAVEHFWHLLRHKGFIYESKHEGWYCVSDECFYPESLIEKRQDPMTGVVHMASTETGNVVEWIEEKNYHFRMTALKDRLLAFYKENPDWVIPAARMKDVVNWVENNLEDLSISRPTERLSWGIQVPDDPSQTIYVWVDALINYMTKAGFPNWAPDVNEQKGGWPADVHVIGKDIVRFHCVYWPALLLAVDLPLPKRILSHAHWTMGGKKMSKSIGNVVNPFFAIDRWGVDPMRFFFIHDGGIAYDADYSNASIVDKYKTHLQNGLGNLTSRMTRPKAWSVKKAVQTIGAEAKDGLKLEESEKRADHEEQLRLLKDYPAAVAAQMEKLDPRLALREITKVIHETNKYVQKTSPWHLAKTLESTPDDAIERELDISVYLAVEALRMSGIFLQAFIPRKAKHMLDVLGVEEGSRTFSHGQVGVDPVYGTPKRDPGKGKFDNLFPPLPVED